MNHRTNLASWKVAACCVTCLAAGCAHAPWSSQLARDISPARETRGAEALQNFESFRNQAQYQAACARWRDGDITTCEKMLQALLTRTPDHREARLTLADLFAATERPELAKQELEKLIGAHPDDPQIHHSLGLLWESMGRTDESLAHLQKAAALEPENDLYSASRETLLAIAPLQRPRTLRREPSTATRGQVPQVVAAPRPTIAAVTHAESVAPEPITPAAPAE